MKDNIFVNKHKAASSGVIYSPFNNINAKIMTDI